LCPFAAHEVYFDNASASFSTERLVLPVRSPRRLLSEASRTILHRPLLTVVSGRGDNVLVLRLAAPLDSVTGRHSVLD